MLVMTADNCSDAVRVAVGEKRTVRIVVASKYQPCRARLIGSDIWAKQDKRGRLVIDRPGKWLIYGFDSECETAVVLDVGPDGIAILRDYP